MRIHKVTITASPSASSDPNDMRGYTWNDADRIEELENAVNLLQEFIAEKKQEIARPIEL